MLTLYDAPRCPFCARVRILLAEKRVEYETVEVDLDDRPAWIYEKNPLGRVPVLEEDAFVLPESAVIMEYLEERYPEPALWPLDAAERALARVVVFRFDAFSGAYYGARRGREGAAQEFERQLAQLDATLEAQPYLTGREYGLADIAYAPWILRTPTVVGVDLQPFPAIVDWVQRLGERPAVAAETDVVAALA